MARRRPQYRPLVGAGAVHDPVRLPGGAAVGGEGLLPAPRSVGDVRPEVADEDRAAVEGVVADEGADAVLEAAGYRGVEAGGRAAVEPPDAPLVGRRVEGSDRDRAVGAVG